LKEPDWQKVLKATTSVMEIFSFTDFFEKAAQSLAELLDADGAALIVYDGPERLRYKMFHGLEVLNQMPVVKFNFSVRNGTVGKALRDGQPLFTADYAQSADAIPEFVAAGLRANLVVPLKGPSEYLGALTIVWLHRKAPQPSAANIAIAEMFAALIGSAVYREALETQLESYSLTDPLTGLPNRRKLMKSLEAAQVRACRNQNLMVVAILDLDGFKRVNDQLGHASGDQALIRAARAIRDAIRAVDTVARLGGDEFVIILEGIRAEANVKVALDRIVRAVFANTGNDVDAHKITASLGATVYPLDFVSPSILLRHADQAMYLSKSRGGNQATILSHLTS
jgi:diguanylate cyclase (GGDEF)-like protein